MDVSEEFLKELIKPRAEIFLEMEKYAKENHVPIMQLAGMESLIHLLSLQKPKTLLELGTAIGYSSMRIATKLTSANIVTIERDVDKANLAKNYIERGKLQDRIEVIIGDALEISNEIFKEQKFDAIFIDAAKGQYKKFFEKYAPLLNDRGVIYCDNLLLNGLSELPMSEVPRRKRTMVRNQHHFTQWLMNHPDYDTAFLPVGDGMLVSIKR
ncbi:MULTISPECIES: O-methyltransferase [Bacillaceae]|uniref:O-methyltransferase n=1 Tax=Bacillaceae TaxID=186817 RepID=UPI0006AFEC48|nr:MULTISPECIES: O-methyltransferase [Bacillaceae]ALC84892.1 SAM-dependent methyltransferase [Bacillus sp. FJAT-22090]KQL34161.1 SAM-dependent methyltransferase [Psychrobacillus sp. FJAT-21963]MDF2066249.1 O-methyltransferase [Bacillus sp. Cr_A10]